MSWGYEEFTNKPSEHGELKTDLYQLTMMAAQFYKGLHKHKVTCEAFIRKLPPERRFLVMAGTKRIKEYLSNLSFSEDDIEFLRTIPTLKSIFASSNFDKYLRGFRFSGDLWMMAEGEIVFAGEPLVRVTGTLPEVHIAETFILSVLNHDVKIASKAARIVLAARGRPVLEFGTRRTHHEAAVDAARAAYLAGFAATSNVEAGKRYGIPLKGTMSHMWVMTHNNEMEAFESFKSAYRNPILLIDTYDTYKGAELAAKIPLLDGVRLDSGDLNILSKEVRNILDSNGCKSAKIIVSSDLDEYKINDLIQSHAPIDCFAVGTELVVSKDVPSLGAVYKVVYDDTNDRPLIKMSPGKGTLPGRKQVFLDQRNSGWSHILAIDGHIKPSEWLSPLLDCHIKNGNVCTEDVELDVSRRYCNAALLSLRPDLASLSPNIGSNVPVYPHESLRELFKETAKKYKLNMIGSNSI
jgi:nicotinate phosphoribosyltransferase